MMVVITNITSLSIDIINFVRGIPYSLPLPSVNLVRKYPQVFLISNVLARRSVCAGCSGDSLEIISTFPAVSIDFSVGVVAVSQQ